jgi:hypothetical protein
MARTCDATTTNQNAATCMRLRPNILYAPIPVVITASDETQGTISFRARDNTGAYPEYKGVRWDSLDLWVECPSTLEGDPSKLPVAQSSGVLYISAAFIKANNLAGRPKWPYALPAEVRTTNVRVWPTSIVVTGIELEDGYLTENIQQPIDLLDPELCATAYDAMRQVLVLDGSAPTLELTDNGLKLFKLSPPTLEILKTAVETIEAKRDPAKIIAAWNVISRWEHAISVNARLADSSVDGLIGRVLDRSTPRSTNGHPAKHTTEKSSTPSRSSLTKSRAPAKAARTAHRK